MESGSELAIISLVLYSTDCYEGDYIWSREFQGVCTTKALLKFNSIILVRDTHTNLTVADISFVANEVGREELKISLTIMVGGNKHVVGKHRGRRYIGNDLHEPHSHRRHKLCVLQHLEAAYRFAPALFRGRGLIASPSSGAPIQL